MKIKKIKINSYGKLKEKEINFKDGINLIYGQNEAGKSTLIKFIINSLYGISKNKKGKEVSDFDKYKPWSGEEFSGKLEYELDNKEKYEIYRDFSKKNPKIFNENMEDISKEFNIDKNKGNEFFYEQTKIDEDLFLSTLAINQSEVKLENQAQNFLIQKIANLAQTGDDSISFKRVMDRINRRQLDEVGTERSREKPINIVARKLQELNAEKENLEKFKNFKYEYEEQENDLKDEILNLENENNFLKEIKLQKENEKIENEKIKIKENIIEENKNKVNIINSNLEKINKKINIEKNEIKNINGKYEKNKLNKRLNLFLLIILLFNILWIIFIPKINNNIIIKYIFLLTVPTYLIIYFLQKNKLNKKIKIIEKNQKNNIEEINLEKNNLENSQKIYQENINNLLNEINKIKIENNFLNNLEENKIINKYEKNIEKNEINYLLKKENINSEINLTEMEINNLKIEKNKLDLQKENIEPQLENLSVLEEVQYSLQEQYSELRKNNESIELVKILLSKAYENMKNNISPIFTKKLSENITEITDGKYKKLTFNDEQGLIVELNNGNYISAERLSTGTIDQLYLSLRLAMLDEISNEKVPIILDESFAYYDDERLKNILNYLVNEFNDRQIIIFTCSHREKDILTQENIHYNFVTI
mgnify:CR=1 FL=1